MTKDSITPVRIDNDNYERIAFLVKKRKAEGKKTNITKLTNKLLNEILSIFKYD